MAMNFAAYSKPIFLHYKGKPDYQSEREWRWGTHGSFSADLAKGTWYDHENKVGGGIIDFVREQEGARIGGIPDLLEKKFGIPKSFQPKLQPISVMRRKYEYIDENGEVRYEVHRSEPKRFSQMHYEDGKPVWNMQGVEALPYNLPALLSAPDRKVFIVEGEKCADAMMEIGALATTNHGGAKNWKPELNRWFAGREVIIVPDNDEAGAAHADKVASELVGVAKVVRRLELDGLQKGGDVVDWLALGNSPAKLAQMAEAAAILDVAPATVETGSSDPSPIYNEQPLGIFDTLDLSALRHMPPPTWLVEGVITAGSLGVIYGEPGAGKSFAALDMALSIAYGRAWHGRAVAPGGVLYIAGEGVGGLGPRVKAWQAAHDLRGPAPFRVLPMAVNIMDPDEHAKLERTLEALGGPWSCVIIDTVARALGAGGADENSAAEMGLFIQACDAVRLFTGGAVLGVAHSGKDAARGIRGSTALLGAVDASIKASRDGDLLALKIEKQKDAEAEAEIVFKMQARALVGGSSMVLEAVDGGKPAGKRRKLTAPQETALRVLANIEADKGRRHPSITVKAWQDAHKVDAPDLTPSQRRHARAALQTGGHIVIADGLVWTAGE